jgi:hypothetical protein
MNLKNCHNFNDFRELARRKLPSPIYNYIDGGADDEVTLKRNTAAFNDCDLIPNVLADVGNIDISTTVLGQKLIFHFFFQQPQCIVFTITKEKGRRQKLQKKWVQCLAYQPWQPLALKK